MPRRNGARYWLLKVLNLLHPGIKFHMRELVFFLHPWIAPVKNVRSDGSVRAAVALNNYLKALPSSLVLAQRSRVLHPLIRRYIIILLFIFLLYLYWTKNNTNVPSLYSSFVQMSVPSFVAAVSFPTTADSNPKQWAVL